MLVPIATGTIIATALTGSASAVRAAAKPSPTPTGQQQSVGTRKVPMPGGETISVAPDGTATLTSAQGTVLGIKKLVVPQGSSGLGPLAGPSDDQVRAAFTQSPYQKAPTKVVAVLSNAITVTGAPVAGKKAFGTRAPVTTNASVNSALAKVGAVSVQPMFPDLSATKAAQLTASARGRLGAAAVDLSNIVLVDLKGGDADAAAKILGATPGVTSALPDLQVTTMSTPPSPLPSSLVNDAQNTQRGMRADKASPTAPGAALPTNFGLTSSAQSYLNAGGINAMGAYSLLENRFGQLPGTGEVITNVSVGDLTDQAMADAGDSYVQQTGPTTIVQNGQRYLDLPSMPLIPTYVADPNAQLDPLGTTERQDPTLGEVMLDFGMMAPLPHNLQRPSAVGSGLTDLLGIAPGAKYRLVVPQEPTYDQIAVALLAAAQQNPRPNVITASLGFGTDLFGFPGRYLEDDPVLQTVIASIVQRYHIVVTIAANDGTRLFTPTAVGPDGGSTPTNTTSDPRATTNINDDQASTTPSQVRDSGAIAVGGTTLDDTMAVSPQTGGPQSSNPTFATTRTDGAGSFSSGFGSRINVSAPSDGIVAFEHRHPGTPQQVDLALTGGTSAAAPMTAAAAAVVLQAARLTGKSMSPEDVRSLLENTGRQVATPPQIDQPLNVGRQIDITAAVSAVLGDAHGSSTSIVRLSVAHRQTIGQLGGEFIEYTDPHRIDLADQPYTNHFQSSIGVVEGLNGPVTIGADVTGLPNGTKPDYVLRIGGHEFHSQVPAVRLTPKQMLAAAGFPLASTTDRTIQLTFEVRSAGGQVLASADQPLVFGPTDGTYLEALAPVAPATVKAGSPVTVHYDLTGVQNVSSPTLVVSTVGHWSPTAAPLFTAAYTTPLTSLTGDVTIPATAFDGGGGIYGIGLITGQVPEPGGTNKLPVLSEFTPIRVDGGTPAQRPAAPTLAAAGSDQFGHLAEIPETAPGFKLRYDVHGVPGAAGAIFEVSAPAAPTIYNSLNTVTNANGTVRDHDGVDTGSIVYQRLPSSNGTVALDAVKLGLPGSLHYSIRVFATDRNGTVIGQASPTSMLTLDSGLAPDGGQVASFAIQPGGTSAVSVFDPATGGESLREYNASTGTYGRTFATDPPTLYQSGYQIIGIDPGVHRLLVLHWKNWGPYEQPCSAANPPSLQTYDTLTTKLVSDVSTGCQYTVYGGRVDTIRHRAAILAHRTSDGADIVLPLTLATGSVGTPIDVDTPTGPAGWYRGIAMNQATGMVYLSHQVVSTAGWCTVGPGALISVNLDSGVLTPARAGFCVDGLDVDAGTNQVYEFTQHAGFNRFLPSVLNLSRFAGDTMNALDPLAVRPVQPAIGLVVDSTHHLALLPYLSSTALGDNNATSQADVVDLTTGDTVSTVSDFNFNTGFWGGHFDPDPTVEKIDAGVDVDNQPMQLDPATRTGWVISGDGSQIQQFKY
ncbi:MAG TPA: S8 family serine peptidase [Pseudonocardiaceae bacterium]